MRTLTSEEKLCWLAGIIDGEGCFTMKRQIVRQSGARQGSRTTRSLWLVLCNTSERMVRFAEEILDAHGVAHPKVRKVWKGERATRWQYWLHVQRKADLLKLTELLLPYLVAKRDEALIVAWYLRRACAAKQYKATAFEKMVLDSMSAIKHNGGEAPAELKELLREVIPSQAASGRPMGGDAEGVEARSVSPDNNPIHECPAGQHLRVVTG